MFAQLRVLTWLMALLLAMSPVVSHALACQLVEPPSAPTDCCPHHAPCEQAPVEHGAPAMECCAVVSPVALPRALQPADDSADDLPAPDGSAMAGLPATPSAAWRWLLAHARPPHHAFAATADQSLLWLTTARLRI